MHKLSFILFILFACLFSSLRASGEICTITTGEQGNETDDCPALHDCIDNQCKHKDIFPLEGREIFGGLLIMVLSGFANAGGIGGGSILTPILLTIYGYTANKAIMIVYVLIFGGSLGNFLNVAFQRDIRTGKPIILYDFALMVTPLMLLGSNVGVLLNKMIAPAITICGLLYLVATTGKKIYARAKTSYEKETQMLQKPLIDSSSPQKVGESLELSPLKNKSNAIDGQPEIPQELEVLLEEEKSFLPKSRIVFLGCLMAFVLMVIILKGTDKFDSVLGIGYCSFGYWIWFIMGLIGCYFFYHKGLNLVKYKDEIKKRYNFKQQDFRISDENIKTIERLGIVAGVLRALLGIGGGMILGNPMLGMGIGAQNMTATCGLFVVLTSFVNLVQAFLMGGITTSEITFFFLTSSIGSYLVSSGLTWFVKKYQRPSILLFSLAGIMGITLVVLPLFTLYKTISNPGQMLQFHSPC